MKSRGSCIETYREKCRPPDNILVMALTADGVFEKIGSFGRYQLLILILFNIIEWFWFGWPVLLMTFIAAEPAWRCISNNTQCALNGTMKPGSNNYDFRCNISRKSWEFVDDFTSVVTQVSLHLETSVREERPDSLISWSPAQISPFRLSFSILKSRSYFGHWCRTTELERFNNQLAFIGNYLNTVKKTFT